jgi:TPR repeat protein
MHFEFYSPIDYPALFYLVLVPLLVMLVVSIARFVEYRGAWLPNLAAHTPLPRILIILSILPLWLYLTYLTFLFTYAFGLAVILVGTSLTPLLYILLGIILYLAISWLFVLWYKGGMISTVIMIVLIVSMSTYVFTQKIGWICKPLAESGVSFAYGCLARAYEYPGGQGLNINAKEMRKWYQKAADAGDSEAAYLVALKTKDSARRNELLEKAAHDGHIKAAYLYSKTLTGEKSLKWLTYAADHDLPAAQFTLGNIYYAGNAVQKDFHKTRELFTRAAEGGYLPAMMQLVSSYASGDALFERDVTKSKKWEDATLARQKELEQQRVIHMASMQEEPHGARGFEYLKHFPSLWENERQTGARMKSGDPVLLTEKARGFVAQQQGDPELRKKAIDIYLQLANKGDAKSQYELAKILLLEGNTPESEQIEGRRWLLAAADRQYEPAINKLIDAYEKGEYGFTVDLEKAKFYNDRKLRILSEKNRHSTRFAYYHGQALQEKIDKQERQAIIEESLPAANAGDADAQFQIAHLLMADGKRKDSLQWREKAAANGHPDAQYLEAQHIMMSALQKQYADRALEYYQSAARQSHPGALAAMGRFYSNGSKIWKLDQNLYRAKVCYQRALSLAQGEIIYKNTFGNPSRTTYTSTDSIRKFLDELPDAIKRLDLEGLSPGKKKEKINNWYYSEIERLKPGEKTADTLNMLNQQRDVLLKGL